MDWLTATTEQFWQLIRKYPIQTQSKGVVIASDAVKAIVVVRVLGKHKRKHTKTFG